MAAARTSSPKTAPHCVTTWLGEAQPRAAVRPGHTLPEPLEDMREMLRWDPDAGVGDGHGGLTRRHVGAGNDAAPGARELDAVADQIGDHLRDAVAVCPGVRKPRRHLADEVPPQPRRTAPDRRAHRGRPAGRAPAKGHARQRTAARDRFANCKTREFCRLRITISKVLRGIAIPAGCRPRPQAWPTACDDYGDSAHFCCHR